MLAGSTIELDTMRISANQTVTTHTPTYTAVKAAGSMDTVNSNGSVVSTVTSADVRENGVAAAPAKPAKERDSSWLELEVCREFARHNCPRTAEECRFAHPDPSLAVKDGVVTCCYDFLKDRCQRQSCKYFHPPSHIKQRLITAGKQFAMMSGYYSAPTSPYVSPLPPAAPVTPILIGAPVMGSPPGIPSLGPAVVATPYGLMTDRLHTCPEFLAGRCTVQMCPLVHPEVFVRCNLDSTVTICRDFSRGGCARERCRYLHPQPHILSQLENALMATVPQGVMMAPAVLPPNFPPMMVQGPPCGIVPRQPVVSGMVPVYPGNPVHIPMSVGVPISHASPIPARVIPISSFSSVPVALSRANTPPSPISVISGQSPLVEALSVPSQDQAPFRGIWMPSVQTVQQ